VYSISVNSADGMTVDQLAAFANRPNGMVMVTTVGELKAAGFVVEETAGQWEQNGHCDLYLERAREELPTQGELDALKAAFTGPIPNPARVGEGCER
jgi:hypothetical protein